MSNRHTILRLSFSAVIAIIGLTVSMLSMAQEAEPVHEAARGNGTVIIEQKNLSNPGLIGSWTLLTPGTGDGWSGTEGSQTLQLEAGSYTLFAKAPDAHSTSIRTYHDKTLLQSIKRPQLAFSLDEGETLSIVIFYNMDRNGTVAVQSDPPGLEFELTGPNGMTETGITPASFENAPEGNYTVNYKTLEGCASPRPLSQKLEVDGRISFDTRLECKQADIVRSRLEKKSTGNGTYVTLTVDGKDVSMFDVPVDSWFARYVSSAIRLNILNGYTDDAGNLNGLYGPGNSVTVAELAKIAHRFAGISEQDYSRVNPENPAATGQWFSPFIASAEARGWTIFNDATIDPLRPATRAEVVVTFLQALDKARGWPKGGMFNDVTVRTKYAGAIESAAADGILDGRMDENGEPLNMFDPDAPINRAEIAKMIHSMLQIYKGIDIEEENDD